MRRALTVAATEKRPRSWKKHLFLALCILSLLATNTLLFAALLSGPLQYLEVKIGLRWTLALELLLAVLCAFVVPVLLAVWSLGKATLRTRFSRTGRVLFCTAAVQILFLFGTLILFPETTRQNLAFTPGRILGEEHLAVRALERLTQGSEELAVSSKAGLNSPIDEVKVMGPATDEDYHRTRLWKSDEFITVFIILRPGHDKARVKADLTSLESGYKESLEDTASDGKDDNPGQAEIQFRRPAKGWDLGKYQLEIFVEEQPELTLDLEIVELEHRKVGKVVRLLTESEKRQAREVVDCWLVDLEPGVDFKTGVATVKRNGDFLGDAQIKRYGADAYLQPLGTFHPQAGDQVFYRQSGPRHCVIEGEVHHAKGTHGKARNPVQVGSSVVFRSGDQYSLYLFEKSLEDHEPAQIYSIRTAPYTAAADLEVQAQTPYPRSHLMFKWSEKEGLRDLRAYWVTRKGDQGSSTYPISQDDIEAISVEGERLQMVIKRPGSEPFWNVQLESDVWEVDDFIELDPET